MKKSIYTQINPQLASKLLKDISKLESIYIDFDSCGYTDSIIFEFKERGGLKIETRVDSEIFYYASNDLILDHCDLDLQIKLLDTDQKQKVTDFIKLMLDK